MLRVPRKQHSRVSNLSQEQLKRKFIDEIEDFDILNDRFFLDKKFEYLIGQICVNNKIEFQKDFFYFERGIKSKLFEILGIDDYVAFIKVLEFINEFKIGIDEEISMKYFMYNMKYFLDSIAVILDLNSLSDNIEEANIYARKNRHIFIHDREKYIQERNELNEQRESEIRKRVFRQLKDFGCKVPRCKGQERERWFSGIGC